MILLRSYTDEAYDLKANQYVIHIDLNVETYIGCSHGT